MRLLVTLVVVGLLGWQGYLYYLKKSAPPGTYRFEGEFKPCTYFGDGETYVRGLRDNAARAKRQAAEAGDSEEVDTQMRDIAEYDAALRYCF